MKIPKFKIRCSQIGQIMTEPKTVKAKEAGELSGTAKSYCELWLKEQLYGRSKEFSSKYTAKGNEVESTSILFIAKMLKLGIVFKNDEYFEDEYKCGTPDIIPMDCPDLIVDAKNSWDWSTFPLFETTLPQSDYAWQGLGYMDLVKRFKYKVAYCLSDTPEYLIEAEARRYCFNNGYDDLEGDIYMRFEQKMTYKDIPDKLKIKVFDVPFSQEKIDLIHERVLRCRHYIKHLLNNK